MIVNFETLIARERPLWEELDAILARIAKDPWRKLTLSEARRFEHLYRRAAADLARLSHYAAEPELRRYLENVVARGHAELHGSNRTEKRFYFGRWLSTTLPQTFRRHINAFLLSVVLTLVGTGFGGAAIAFDPGAKEVLMPFEHLQGNPNDRVAREQANRGADLRDRKARFSGALMTHNTQVALTAMALGLSWGVGTLVIIFYNGVTLGAIAMDYILAGQTPFLLGWLLPHGSVEIPAILMGGQAGFVLASALLGRGERRSLAARFKAIIPDVATLSMGASLMLVWAGIVEAFFSQYHEPVLPYSIKIAFGISELVALIWYYSQSGLSPKGKKTG